MIPKLKVKYSFIYDQILHKYNHKKFGESSWKEGEKYKNKFQKSWDKIGDKSFKLIAKYSGLTWKEPFVDAYIVKHVSMPFSRPLTLMIWSNLKEQQEIVIHELIHNIFVQNRKQINWSKLEKDYPKYKEAFRVHLLLHAILKKVLLEIYGEKQTKKFIKTYYREVFPKVYGQAWDQVDKIGADEIIKKYIKKK